MGVSYPRSTADWTAVVLDVVVDVVLDVVLDVDAGDGDDVSNGWCVIVLTVGRVNADAFVVT